LRGWWADCCLSPRLCRMSFQIVGSFAAFSGTTVSVGIGLALRMKSSKLGELPEQQLYEERTRCCSVLVASVFECFDYISCCTLQARALL
jgi:hypothetical protein